jgi:hypothetical protein
VELFRIRSPNVSSSLHGVGVVDDGRIFFEIER